MATITQKEAQKLVEDRIKTIRNGASFISDGLLGTYRNNPTKQYTDSDDKKEWFSKLEHYSKAIQTLLENEPE